MYAKQFSKLRQKHRPNGVRASFKKFGTWLGIGFVTGLCLIGCLSCGVHREFIHTIAPNPNNGSYLDTSTVMVIRQSFPRKITRIRIR